MIWGKRRMPRSCSAPREFECLLLSDPVPSVPGTSIRPGARGGICVPNLNTQPTSRLALRAIT